jgi:hypothetical protein
MTILLFLKCFFTFFVSSLLVGVVGLILENYGYNRFSNNFIVKVGDLFIDLSAFLVKFSIVIVLTFFIFAIWHMG